MMWSNGSWLWWWPLGVILMVAFWGLIIAGIVLVVRWVWNVGQPSAPRGESALEVLKRRYARGDISKAEYEEKRKDLE